MVVQTSTGRTSNRCAMRATTLSPQTREGNDTMQLSRISEFKTEILGDELPSAPIEPTFDLNHDTTHFILEEVDELRKAQAEGDIVEIADALGDIIYFAAGQALKYGLPIDEIIEEHLINGRVVERLRI